jgi:hypothetical protein
MGLAVLVSFAMADTASAADGDAYINECLTKLAATDCSATLKSHPVGLAESPDGRQIYAGLTAVSAGTFGGLQIFDRNPSNGQVAPRAGTGGCFAPVGSGAACTLIGGGGAPNAVWDVVITPDGKNVIIAAQAGGVYNFARNLANGSLTFLGCIGPGTGCTAMAGTATAYALAVSPDNRNVYVKTSDGLVVLDRAASTLVLTQKPGQAGCFTEAVVPNCTKVVGLSGAAFKIRVSPDGAHLYVPFSNPGGISFFNRFSDGTLTQITGTAGGCISSSGRSANVDGQCKDGNDGLASSYATSVSPDGKSVYVAGESGVTNYSRNAVNGVLTQTQCFGATAGCTATTPTIANSFDVETSADGTEVVATQYLGASVLLFQRSTTGALTRRPGNRGCITSTGNAGTCQTLAGLAWVTRVAFDPGNLLFYLTGQNIGLLATIARDFAPVCQSATVDVVMNTAINVPLTCSDVNNDPLTFERVTSPKAGLLADRIDDSGNVFYNPFGGFTGNDSFTFRGIGRGVASAPATISLRVTAPPPSGGGGGGVVVPSGIDNDRDGFFAGQDCNDADPAIRPGALEIKGNRIDENCDGLAEAFPTLASGVVHNWGFSKRSTSFTLRVLSITQQLPKGIGVTVKCSGKKCPLKSKKLKLPKVKKNALNVFGSLTKKQRKFRAGQTVEVWVSAPNFNTKVARIKLKKGKTPVIEALCVVPGQTKPVKKCD